MVAIRQAAIADAERILEIYDYYVKNTAITFGRWYDMIWMEKIIGVHRDQQPPVIYPAQN